MSIQYLKHSTNGNCKRKIISEAIEMEEHNLSCYSANVARTKAKIGYDEEWANTKEKLSLLNQMHGELPDSEGYCAYVGTMQEFFYIGGYGYIKFAIISSDTQKHQEIFYFKLSIAVAMKFEVMPNKTNNLMLDGIVAIRVKNGTIENIHYLEKGEN